MSTLDAQPTTIDHLFANDAAPADAPSQIQSEEAPAPSSAEQSPVPQAPAAEAPKEDHRVPLAELIETRKRAQAAEQERAALLETLQRLTQPQQPRQQPEPVDPIADPEGAYAALQQQMQNALLNQRLDFSDDKARTQHGSEVVDLALEAAQKAGFLQSFIKTRDPYAELVKWHQGQTLRDEIGDPAAYKARLIAEIKAELLGGKPVTATSTATPNLPPSLASATKANATPDVLPSDRDFFNSMMSTRRTQ